jgi:hypothetical protein
MREEVGRIRARRGGATVGDTKVDGIEFVMFDQWSPIFGRRFDHYSVYSAKLVYFT